MRRFRAIVAGAVAVALALAMAGVTLAKGDRVVATLDAPLPVDAAAWDHRADRLDADDHLR